MWEKHLSKKHRCQVVLISSLSSAARSSFTPPPPPRSCTKSSVLSDKARRVSCHSPNHSRINICKSLSYKVLFPKKINKSQLQHGNPQTPLPRNLQVEEAKDAFIKCELRVSEVASLAKKPVMLTAMLINIALLLIFPSPLPQLLSLAHSHRYSFRSSSSLWLKPKLWFLASHAWRLRSNSSRSPVC